MPAYNSGSTRQLKSRKGQLTSDAPYHLPTVSISMASQTRDIIISEGIITDGPSPTTDVDAAMMNKMAAGSRREDTAPAPASIMDNTAPTGDVAPSREDAAPASIIKKTLPGSIRSSTPINGPTGQLSEDAAEAAAPVSIIEGTLLGGIRPSTPIDDPVQPSEDAAEDAAPASIIEETIPGDIETSIRDEASTHVNILDPASGKATVDEDSAMVAMDEGTLIPMEKTGGEELSAVGVSTGNLDHDTIIVEEGEDARFELDEEGPQVEMPQSPTVSRLMQTIIIEDFDDEQIADIDEVLDYIRGIVERDVLDKDIKSKYSDDNSNSGSPQ
ncbi:hypothetical protein BKA65DRAFT_545105 [Rhexocercosporidium sp. MPI-PUGE-AT-0058]|nr:hypothetical protein BKA65DRAFT_545105 [Rhexocercosporidium sp. MPI-PUGE-AT-0058]